MSITNPRHHRSNLFPYTTLFRSQWHQALTRWIEYYTLQRLEEDFCRGSWWTINFYPNRDRKSTRLNSSHGYISYAVFCLKKKNLSKTSTLMRLTLITRSCRYFRL